MAMDNPSIPEDLRRFVLTSIPSVPFLEALLLMRADPDRAWRRDTLARRLYVREKTAEDLVEVTHLIHSSLDRKAQQFADAFKWRKDS